MSGYSGEQIREYFATHKIVSVTLISPNYESRTKITVLDPAWNHITSLSDDVLMGHSEMEFDEK